MTEDKLYDIVIEPVLYVEGMLALALLRMLQYSDRLLDTNSFKLIC